MSEPDSPELATTLRVGSIFSGLRGVHSTRTNPCLGAQLIALAYIAE